MENLPFYKYIYVKRQGFYIKLSVLNSVIFFKKFSIRQPEASHMIKFQADFTGTNSHMVPCGVRKAGYLHAFGRTRLKNTNFLHSYLSNEHFNNSTDIIY